MITTISTSADQNEKVNKAPRDEFLKMLDPSAIEQAIASDLNMLEDANRFLPKKEEGQNGTPDRNQPDFSKRFMAIFRRQMSTALPLYQEVPPEQRERVLGDLFVQMLPEQGPISRARLQAIAEAFGDIRGFSDEIRQSVQERTLKVFIATLESGSCLPNELTPVLSQQDLESAAVLNAYKAYCTMLRNVSNSLIPDARLDRASFPGTRDRILDDGGVQTLASNYSDSHQDVLLDRDVHSSNMGLGNRGNPPDLVTAGSATSHKDLDTLQVAMARFFMFSRWGDEALAEGVLCRIKVDFRDDLHRPEFARAIATIEADRAILSGDARIKQANLRLKLDTYEYKDLTSYDRDALRALLGDLVTLSKMYLKGSTKNGVAADPASAVEMLHRAVLVERALCKKYFEEDLWNKNAPASFYSVDWLAPWNVKLLQALALFEADHRATRVAQEILTDALNILKRSADNAKAQLDNRPREAFELDEYENFRKMAFHVRDVAKEFATRGYDEPAVQIIEAALHCQKMYIDLQLADENNSETINVVRSRDLMCMIEMRADAAKLYQALNQIAQARRHYNDAISNIGSLKHGELTPLQKQTLKDIKQLMKQLST